MIEQIDERVCQNLDNSKEYAERRAIVHLLNKLREVIDAVNNLELNKLDRPTKEQLTRLDELTKDIEALRNINTSKVFKHE